ncbi:hypothetical protein Syun_007038 [Stephania yunnanensis]|uniref:RRM domain-containing protein n=1 Tax=Stephania yunnanensis TaxID=152371 RepID=A0AAP0KZH0_9MAGN
MGPPFPPKLYFVLERLKNLGVEQIEEIYLPDNPNKEGKSKGYALLEFKTPFRCNVSHFNGLNNQMLFLAVIGVRKLHFPSRFILVKKHFYRFVVVKTVYLEGLAESWEEDKLKKLCEQYGEDEKVQLSRKFLSTRRKDFGFVSFVTRESAVACVEGINKAEIGEGDNKDQFIYFGNVRRHYDMIPACSCFVPHAHGYIALLRVTGGMHTAQFLDLLFVIRDMEPHAGYVAPAVVKQGRDLHAYVLPRRNPNRTCKSAYSLVVALRWRIRNASKLPNDPQQPTIFLDMRFVLSPRFLSCSWSVSLLHHIRHMSPPSLSTTSTHQPIPSDLPQDLHSTINQREEQQQVTHTGHTSVKNETIFGTKRRSNRRKTEKNREKALTAAIEA